MHSASARRDVASTIAAYRPRSLSAEAAAFSRRVVAGACPRDAQRAKALLFAAGRLAGFGLEVGLPLDEEVLFRDGVIERFIATARLSEVTRRTVRANLRFLKRRVLAHPSPAPLQLPRSRAKPPYSEAEIASYLALCDAQPTRLRQVRASALICLGAGAGLVGGELRGIAGSDVVRRSGGLLVVVRGKRARAVPVLGPFHERLLQAAAFFGEGYLVAGHNPDSHNVTNPLLASLSGGADLARLETARLRSSYLSAMAETIGLKAFMEAAGITCSQRLGDLLASLSPLEETEAVALLGAKLP